VAARSGAVNRFIGFAVARNVKTAAQGGPYDELASSQSLIGEKRETADEFHTRRH
jgi:hypothetical protein